MKQKERKGLASHHLYKAGVVFLLFSSFFFFFFSRQFVVHLSCFAKALELGPEEVFASLGGRAV